MEFKTDNDGTSAMWSNHKVQLEKEARVRIAEERNMSLEERRFRRVKDSKSFFKR